MEPTVHIAATGEINISLKIAIPEGTNAARVARDLFDSIDLTLCAHGLARPAEEGQ